MPLPKIKDIAVVAERVDNKAPIGEAPTKGSSADPMSPLKRIEMTNRLYSAISDLMDLASDNHTDNCKIPGTDTVDLDYITRLSTNEFFFYTQEPLTKDEFEALQEKIAAKAKTLPSGIQLILGSFAVKTPDNEVMNITPHITCGDPPTFHFIVKNYTSTIDVRYKEYDPVFGLTTLPIVNVNSYSPKISIVVDGQERFFKFKNVLPCATPAGTPFLTVVEVCCDHTKAVGGKYINKLQSKEAKGVDPHLPVSHVVISNTIILEADKCYGSVMHVDPYFSTIQCKKNADQDMRHSKISFGSSPAKIYEVSAVPCQKLGQALQDMELAKNIKIEAEEQLTLLEKQKFGIDDIKMTEFINKKRLAIDDANTNEDRIVILNELKITCSEVISNCKEVRASITVYRHGSSFFTFGASEKANQIEGLMSKIPIKDRRTFPKSDSAKEFLEKIKDLDPKLYSKYHDQEKTVTMHFKT